MTEVRPATQNQVRAEQLIEALFTDPELGAKIHERAAKMFGDIKSHANTIINETVVKPAVTVLEKKLEATQEQLAKALDLIEKREKREEEEKTVNEMRSSVKDAVSKYKLTPEGEQAMLDWMKENRVYNAEAAAAVIVHNAPPQPTSGPSWAHHKTDFYGTAKANEAYADLHKDPMGFMDAEIGKFLKNPEAYASEAA